jgi:ATP-dependent DNA helicase PIF1
MLAELIEAASLIIWDEAFMTHRNAFEALDRSLRDLLSLKSTTIPFGGKVIVLGGDPKQILPVIEGGNRAQIINAAITNSPLWNSVTILHLTQNMRLHSTDLTDSEKTKLADFSAWILNIGNDNIPAIQKLGEMEPTRRQIPSEFLLLPQEDHISALIATVYLEITENYNDPTYLQQRAALTPTNEIADLINEHVVDLIPGTHKKYLSCDWIASQSNAGGTLDLLYPVEFLNSINSNNFPQHKQLLKEGVPIILLRNLNQFEGLCNGTRLITALGDMILEAQILTGTHARKKVLIPRICLALKTNKNPFVLERRQYPIKICYVLTINKSQGQTLSQVGIYLKKPVFTHG